MSKNKYGYTVYFIARSQGKVAKKKKKLVPQKQREDRL